MARLGTLFLRCGMASWAPGRAYRLGPVGFGDRNRNKLWRNGIARKSGPWSSYMLARVRSGEGVVPIAGTCAARAGRHSRPWAATKGVAKPESGGWRALVSVAEFWHGELGQHCCPMLRPAPAARPFPPV